MRDTRPDSEKQHRRSIRLKGYDYSSAGSYFFTICAQGREKILGEINNNRIILNNAGKMVEQWLIATTNKFNNISINEYVIMPNHLHCIISLIDVGADTWVCPDENKEPHGANTQVRPYKLFEIIQWFKTMTTNEYIKGVKNGIYPAFNKRIWQRNYYERIIRNQEEFNTISEYIINNPANWLIDENNIYISFLTN
ncbi:MAG TPA: hypothetical protein P5556_08805 [Candidatus Gastranaerophilales bacterium]|nr:hypothetical protein [Candidatus Gastranaerophilales bacterium]